MLFPPPKKMFFGFSGIHRYTYTIYIEFIFLSNYVYIYICIYICECIYIYTTLTQPTCHIDSNRAKNYAYLNLILCNYIYSILGYIACILHTQQKVSLRMYFAIWTHYSLQLIQQQQTSHGHCLPKKRMVVPSMRFNIGSIRNPIHSDGMAFPPYAMKGDDTP